MLISNFVERKQLI